MSDPFEVVAIVGDDGCCTDLPGLVALAPRLRAEKWIAEYDAAVKRAEAAGAHGICHVGDYRIAEPGEAGAGLNSLRERLGPHLYLHHYWEAP